ncbi:MAG: type IV secretion system DNA-binding domain-containing protein [Halobacteriaceae archaeon]
MKLSSQNANARWDPFMDFDQSMESMETIAGGIFDNRKTKSTGWTEPARSMLICALAVTSARYDDFAKLPDVIAQGPEFIIDEMAKIPETELYRRTIESMDPEARTTTYHVLINQLRPLLQTAISNESLPRVSLQSYFANPEDSVIVLDNNRRNNYTDVFWRFFCSTAIDLSLTTTGEQQFLLDELDKLPEIENLDELVSAGRAAGAYGILVAQDVHQLRSIYGDQATTLWSNTPNSICFQVGDTETAAFALSSIGTQELPTRTVRMDGSDGHVTQQIQDKQPLLTGDLMNLDVGEALIQSNEGWWLCRPRIR